MPLKSAETPPAGSNGNDGWKSRKLWFGIGSTVFSLITSFALCWEGKMPPEQYVQVVQWVPVAILTVFGGLEAAKFIMGNKKGKADGKPK